MSQLVRGFFGKDDSKSGATLNFAQDSNDNLQFRDLEDSTFEPIETTSEKRSYQVTQGGEVLAHPETVILSFLCSCMGIQAKTNTQSPT